MEIRGAVNQYMPYPTGRLPVYTINLSNGTTPFITLFHGREYASQCYRLSNPPRLAVSHAWYRPTREEFDALDANHQDHVLNGGLLCAELSKARPMPDDPVQVQWDYETFQEWCLTAYGKRRPPLPETKGKPS